ncbi:hypothetical protein R6Q59_017848 [Mikania micrantha]
MQWLNNSFAYIGQMFQLKLKFDTPQQMSMGFENPPQMSMGFENPPQMSMGFENPPQMSMPPPQMYMPPPQMHFVDGYKPAQDDFFEDIYLDENNEINYSFGRNNQESSSGTGNLNQVLEKLDLVIKSHDTHHQYYQGYLNDNINPFISRMDVIFYYGENYCKFI